MPEQVSSKTCTKCGETKPLGEYPKNGRGGHRADCKPCHCAAVMRIYHADVAEARRKNNERQRRYYAENPEKFKARSAQFRAEHPELHIACSAAWAAANPAKVHAYKRKWDLANPEARRNTVRKRRARRHDAFVAEVKFEAILLRDLGICGICSKSITDNTIELDHVIPLAAGGTHEPDNVQIAHAACNRRKCAKLDYSLADEPMP